MVGPSPTSRAALTSTAMFRSRAGEPGADARAGSGEECGQTTERRLTLAGGNHIRVTGGAGTGAGTTILR